MTDLFSTENAKYLDEDKARNLADTSWDVPFHTIGKGATQAAPGNHKHTYSEVGIRTGVYDVGTVNASSTKGPITVPHKLGRIPTAVFLTVAKDSGNMSLACNVSSYDITNIVFYVKNTTVSAVTGKVSWLVL